MSEEPLPSRVAENDGLLKVELGQLRNSLGYTRLGRYVLAEIAESLANEDIGYFPAWLLDPDFNTEPRQSQEVWLYQRDGGRVSAVLDAVLNPFVYDVRTELTKFVDDKVRRSDREKLDVIRRIVEQD
ncbi:hypothetical protein HQ325_15275 [Rhodococcus sp. BP-349]|uniref:hypothetical protein n=1 Tax=unclassified Rhodococcus (in: high G+C Gram-positive bacteria) TaxID=192944 RepID=UPI001C9B3FB8|nr:MULTISPECIES: hypothetical protein [unclassified Rhodococcus (in: high G+C Gram-positive bacteria)]MBY6540036.1 hypothetical protein [Rhodococcus sp. BP-363]MBY6543636.1 hypothetical protein [Rhodococcus sp. BP-369]MBY6562866.1 hypothetical protein [Rhodococcus sp. BP-370]MBY6577158.1 hypothetical protein [Rhodococcus sp. BP-364]MBY6586459.1 hypothetical protein [Rhodococcus sp. BP-358]